MRDASLIDPIADPDWLGLVEQSPNAEIFHHPRWLELLRSQYGYGFQACCIGNGRGIEAGIPIARIDSRLTGRRLVSLPFSDVCSPALADDADPAVPGALSEALVEESRRARLGLTVHAPLSETPGAVVQHRFFRHLLPLEDDLAEVERGYSKSRVKRGIKKAQREGLGFERRTDSAALDTFYALHLETRRRQGVPTQPKRFIRRFEDLFAEGLGFVGIVLDENRPIAAAVFLTHKTTITYKYGASEARGLEQAPQPPALLRGNQMGLRRGLSNPRLRKDGPRQRGPAVLQEVLGGRRNRALLHLRRRFASRRTGPACVTASRRRRSSARPPSSVGSPERCSTGTSPSRDAPGVQTCR